MQRDLLIPTAWDLDRLKPLLESIARQTTAPDRVVFLVHGSRDAEALEMIEEIIREELSDISSTITVTHHLDSDYQPGQGVGYDRDRLARQATSEYLYMIDDDNIFDEKFFASCLAEYEELGDVLWSPLIEYRRSGEIQSAGIRSMHRWMPIYLPSNFLLWWLLPTGKVKMIGANSLLWPTTLFQSIWFDPQYMSCLEDVDFSYRVYLSGTQILVSDHITIHHMERQKSLLKKKFLWNPEIAFERSRNRITFCKKNATLWQKIQYFGVGLRGQTFWFLVLSLVYWGEQRWSIFGSILKWTFDGIMSS